METLECFTTKEAPEPLGRYSHAVRYGDFIYVCGMGPREVETNRVPGLELDGSGQRVAYNIRLETQATLENLKVVLEAAGSAMERIVEINVFLTDMKDFSAMNEVYAEYFPEHRPVRTTLGVQSLPGQISVEMKAVAVRNP